MEKLLITSFSNKRIRSYIRVLSDTATGGELEYNTGTRVVADGATFASAAAGFEGPGATGGVGTVASNSFWRATVG